MKNLLRFEAVTLRRGGRVLFENLDLELNSGEAIQLLGANGSGKSSLMRLAAGLLCADEGRVHRAPCALADEAIALDRELPLHRALKFWAKFPDAAMRALGLEELGPVPVRFLSSGQLKRATIARVAASGAPLWLLDEPLNGLDANSALQLSTLVEAHLAGGGAVVAASHQQLAGVWRRLELGK